MTVRRDRKNWLATRLACVLGMILMGRAASAETAHGNGPGNGHEPAQVRFYVQPPESADDWTRTAQEVWTGGELRIDEWPDPGCPPSSYGEDAHLCGYLEGPPESRILVLQEQDGTQRQLPVPAGERTDEQARTQVLLMLQSLVTPMAVTDEGWVPAEPEAPAPGSTPAGPDPSAGPGRERPRASVRGALGVSGRFGLDNPLFNPAFRLGFALGPSDRSRTDLLLCWTGEFFGGHRMGSIQVSYNGFVVEGGLAFRIGPDRVQLLLRPTMGVRLAWFGTDETGVPAPGVQATPAMRLAVGGSISLGKRSRLEPAVHGGPDLVVGEPAYQLVGGDSTHDVSGWTLGVEVGLTFGGRPHR